MYANNSKAYVQTDRKENEVKAADISSFTSLQQQPPPTPSKKKEETKDEKERFNWIVRTLRVVINSIGIMWIREDYMFIP